PVLGKASSDLPERRMRGQASYPAAGAKQRLLEPGGAFSHVVDRKRPPWNAYAALESYRCLTVAAISPQLPPSVLSPDRSFPTRTSRHDPPCDRNVRRQPSLHRLACSGRDACECR